jgi:hypothetical protein
VARKPNYDFEKRKKELDRKAKKEAKREDRLRRRREGATDEPVDEPVDESPESPLSAEDEGTAAPSAD